MHLEIIKHSGDQQTT